jgi:hypothetical protein
MSNPTTKISTIEAYNAGESTLYEGNGEIVMPVGDQAIIRLKPFGYGTIEVSIDKSWVCLDRHQAVDLRFALGEMLKRIGVENVD